jgi:Cof subfamily protein (haloacid dehalogenase superfamily)
VLLLSETAQVRLIGIDVDGTLVGSSGEILPQVWQAARRAREAGIRLVLCSGRPAFGITLEYASGLDPDGWHVFQNGASIVHLRSRESLSSNLPASAVEQVVAAARECARVLELYSDTEYVTDSTSAWAREHADLLGVPFEPRPFESLRGPVVRAQWLVSAADAPLVIDRAPSGLEVAQSSSPLMPDTRFVGLTRAGISKGSAIRSVAQKYGIDLAQVMYVGDSGNDLSALRIVGQPVAMGNADAAVVAAARHVVSHVDDGGLAEALALAARNAHVERHATD